MEWEVGIGVELSYKCRKMVVNGKCGKMVVDGKCGKMFVGYLMIVLGFIFD